MMQRESAGSLPEREAVPTFGQDRRGSMIPRVGILAAIAVLLSASAAHYLASRTEADRQALASLIRYGRVVTAAPDIRRDVDPAPVGSIARRADATRIDPCGPDVKR